MANIDFGVQYDSDDEFLGLFSFPYMGSPKPELIQERDNKGTEGLLHPLQNAVPRPIPIQQEAVQVNLPVTEAVQQATGPIVAGETTNKGLFYPLQNAVPRPIPIQQGTVQDNLPVTEAVQQATGPIVAGETANDYQPPASEETMPFSETDNPRYLWQRTTKFNDPKKEKRRLGAIKAKKNRVAAKKKVTGLQASLDEQGQSIKKLISDLEKKKNENKMLRSILNLPQAGRLNRLPYSANGPERYLALLAADNQRVQALYRVSPANAISVIKMNSVIAGPRLNILQNPVSVTGSVLAPSGNIINQAINNILPVGSGSAVVQTGRSIVDTNGSQVPSVASTTPPSLIFQGGKTDPNIPIIRIVTGNPNGS